MNMLRICTECSQAFDSYRGIGLTCSKDCRRARRNRMQRERIGLAALTYKCSVCQEGFTPIRRNQVRCSPECTRRHDAARANAYNKRHKDERKVYMREYEQRPESRKRKAEREAGYRQTPHYQARMETYRKSERGRAVYRRGQSKRRASMRGAKIVEDIPTVNELLDLQGGKCANCSLIPPGAVHVDHIMPLALGGAHERANLQALCRTCNQRKHAKHPIQFAREEGRLI